MFKTAGGKAVREARLIWWYIWQQITLTKKYPLAIFSSLLPSRGKLTKAVLCPFFRVVIAVDGDLSVFAKSALTRSVSIWRIWLVFAQQRLAARIQHLIEGSKLAFERSSVLCTGLGLRCIQCPRLALECFVQGIIAKFRSERPAKHAIWWEIPWIVWGRIKDSFCR